MSDKKTVDGIFPRTKSDRDQLLGILGIVLGIVLAVVGLFYLRQSSQLARERDWASSVGTIENTRTNLVSEFSGLYGGSMSYNVQVLVAFSVNGSPIERWITVEQTPKTLDSANIEAAYWKGTKCIVRWNPSNLNQLAVDLHGFPELR